MLTLSPEEHQFLCKLQSLSVDFTIIGGAAAVFHGHNRPRKDLDLLLLPTEQNISAMIAAVPAEVWLPENAADAMLKPCTMFNLLPALKIEVMSSIEGFETETVFARSVKGNIDGLDLRFISIADLIENKRIVGSGTDLRDAEALEAIHNRN